MKYDKILFLFLLFNPKIMTEVIMKKIIAAILISSLLFSNCAYDISKGRDQSEQNFYSKVNKICEDKDELLIVTTDNKTYRANKLLMTIDTTSFYDLDLNQFEKINTENITKIEFPGTGTGTLEGLMFGGLAGGVIANILSNPVVGTHAREGKAIYLMLGIAGGAIIGILYNILYPSNTTIYFKK